MISSHNIINVINIQSLTVIIITYVACVLEVRNIAYLMIKLKNNEVRNMDLIFSILRWNISLNKCNMHEI